MWTSLEIRQVRHGGIRVKVERYVTNKFKKKVVERAHGQRLGLFFFVLTREPVWFALGAIGAALDWKGPKVKPHEEEL